MPYLQLARDCHEELAHQEDSVSLTEPGGNDQRQVRVHPANLVEQNEAGDQGDRAWQHEGRQQNPKEDISLVSSRAKL
jgi:hypothetical protein